MIDGVAIKKIIRHPDERGFLAELIRKNDAFFSEGFGQLSRSYMHQGVVKAWHVHKTQVDWWYAICGTLKVALFDLRPSSATYRQLNEFYLGESAENTDDIILKIPPGIAHGTKVIKGPAELIYVTSQVYKKEEEGRISYNDSDINYDWIQGMPIVNKFIK